MENKNISIYPSYTNVKHISRTVLIKDTVWLVHSGSAIEFLFSGYYLEIKIKSDGSFVNEPDLQPRFAIIVDEEIKLDLTMDEVEKIIKVIDEPKENEKIFKIKIIKLSEEKYGSVGVNEMKIKSLKEDPIKPTENKKIKIEFIGDSITCGYAVESNSPSEKFQTKTENFMKTYSYLTAKELNADYFTVCFSGYGVITGFAERYTNGDKDLTGMLPPFYETVGQINSFNKYEWNFKEHEVDLILINLGTNDYSYINFPNCDFKSRANEFMDGYQKFLGFVRKKNPSSFILCTHGMAGTSELYPYIEKAVNKYKEESKDERIKCFLSPDIDPKDGYGVYGHPKEITNIKNTKIIVEEIKKALGEQK